MDINLDINKNFPVLNSWLKESIDHLCLLYKFIDEFKNQLSKKDIYVSKIVRGDKNVALFGFAPEIIRFELSHGWGITIRQCELLLGVYEVLLTREKIASLSPTGLTIRLKFENNDIKIVDTYDWTDQKEPLLATDLFKEAVNDAILNIKA